MFSHLGANPRERETEQQTILSSSPYTKPSVKLRRPDDEPDLADNNPARVKGFELKGL